MVFTLFSSKYATMLTINFRNFPGGFLITDPKAVIVWSARSIAGC
jgi:hypothetical protein